MDNGSILTDHKLQTAIPKIVQATDLTWRLVGDVLDETLEGVHLGEGGITSPF